MIGGRTAGADQLGLCSPALVRTRTSYNSGLLDPGQLSDPDPFCSEVYVRQLPSGGEQQPADPWWSRGQAA